MHVVRPWLMVLGWMSLGDGRTVVDGQGSWGRRRGGGGGVEGAWAGEVGR